MTRAETALGYFDDGCDCGKALLRAYEPILVLDAITRAGYRASCAPLPGSPSERCGVVSAALEVLTHLGLSDARASEVLTARFKDRFLTDHASMSCKELLGYDLTVLGDFSEAIDTDAVNRVCRGLLSDACAIIEEILVDSRAGFVPRNPLRSAAEEGMN